MRQVLRAWAMLACLLLVNSCEYDPNIDARQRMRELEHEVTQMQLEVNALEQRVRAAETEYTLIRIELGLPVDGPAR